MFDTKDLVSGVEMVAMLNENSERWRRKSELGESDPLMLIALLPPYRRASGCHVTMENGVAASSLVTCSRTMVEEVYNLNLSSQLLVPPVK